MYSELQTGVPFLFRINQTHFAPMMQHGSFDDSAHFPIEPNIISFISRMEVEFWQKRSKFLEFKSFENIVYKFEKLKNEISFEIKSPEMVYFDQHTGLPKKSDRASVLWFEDRISTSS